MPVKLELSKKAEKIFNDLKPSSLDILENRRLRYLKQYNTRRKLNWRLSLPLLIMVVLGDIYVNGLHVGLSIYSAVPILLVGFFKVPMRNYKRKYRRYFKQIFIPAFFRYLFNYEYTNQEDMLDRKLEHYKLIGDYHTFFGEDYLSGVIDKDIKMEFEEIDVIGDLNNFKGGAVLLEMPNKFKGCIIIKAKAVFRDSAKIEEGLEKLYITNQLFDRHFDVYTNNLNDAEKLITDKLMKKILDTSKKLHDLFTEEFLHLAPQYNHAINGYKNNVERKMSTATLELEIKDNKVLMLLRGQYDILAPAHLSETAYCVKRLSVIEQEFKAVESIAKLIKQSY